MSPTTLGVGGPQERTVPYFGGKPEDWLKTPLAPLVIAALGAKAREVSPELPPVLLAERARVGSRKPPAAFEASAGLPVAHRATLSDVLRVKRAGISLPEKIVRDWRDLLAQMKSTALSMSDNRAYMRTVIAARNIREGRQAEVAEAVGEVDRLAALWRLFRIDPVKLHKMNVAPSIIAIQEPHTQFVNGMLCEMWMESMLLVHQGNASPAKTRARAQIFQNIAALSEEIAESPAPPEMVDEIAQEYDFQGRHGENVWEDGMPLAWALAEQSEGSGTWHCPRCAGFSYDIYSPRLGRYQPEHHYFGTGDIPDCLEFLMLFYPDVLDYWLIPSGIGDLDSHLIRSAMGKLAAPLGGMEPDGIDMPEVASYGPITENMEYMHPSAYAREDPILALGFLKSPKDEFFQMLWDDFEWDRSEWLGDIRRFSRKLTSAQHRILKNLQRTLFRAGKARLLPIEIWARILPYQEQWIATLKKSERAGRRRGVAQTADLRHPRR